MTSTVSLNIAFAQALAAQVESVGLATLDAPRGDPKASKLETANLLATLDPTRAAFASALLRIDVANAPEVAGPYRPDASSGPLTEDDIFDPSNLYSLPGQELALVQATAPRPETETALARASSRDAGADPGGMSNESEAGQPGGTEPRSAPAMRQGSRLPPDIGGMTILDNQLSTLTLERLVADHMSLQQAGLRPMKRKSLRGLASRLAPFFEARRRSASDKPEDDDTEQRQE